MNITKSKYCINMPTANFINNNYVLFKFDVQQRVSANRTDNKYA